MFENFKRLGAQHVYKMRVVPLMEKTNITITSNFMKFMTKMYIKKPLKETSRVIKGGLEYCTIQQ